MNATELKRRLAALRWSQKALAQRLSVDQDTVSRWCTGKTAVPGYVAEYLRVIDLAKGIIDGSL